MSRVTIYRGEIAKVYGDGARMAYVWHAAEGNEGFVVDTFKGRGEPDSRLEFDSITDAGRYAEHYVGKVVSCCVGPIDSISVEG